jgi:hypothetical protein
MEWNSASESGGSASDFGADTGSVAAPASSYAGPARRGSASDFAADTAVLQRLLLRPLDRLALSVSSSLGPFPVVHSKSRRLFRPLATVVGEPSADSIATDETVCLARKL